MNTRTVRVVGAVGGLLFVVLALGSEILGPGGVSFSAPAADFAAFWTKNRDAIDLTRFLYGLSAVAFLVFVAALRSELRGLEPGEPFLTNAATLGGMLAITLVLASYGLDAGLAAAAAGVGGGAGGENALKLAAVSASVVRHFAFFGTVTLAGAGSLVVARARGGARWVAALGAVVVVVDLVALLGIALPIGSRPLNVAAFAVVALWILAVSAWMASRRTPTAA